MHDAQARRRCSHTCAIIHIEDIARHAVAVAAATRFAATHDAPRSRPR
jgi:hypothetical protein